MINFVKTYNFLTIGDYIIPSNNILYIKKEIGAYYNIVIHFKNHEPPLMVNFNSQNEMESEFLRIKYN